MTSVDLFKKLVSLKATYDHTNNSKNRKRWLNAFDTLYRSSEEGQIQALLFSQSKDMNLIDHDDYINFNHNSDYDEEEIEKEGISDFTMEDQYHLYQMNIRLGYPNFTLPPTNLQPLFNHACRMGNLKIVDMYIRYNHNHRQPQLNLRLGLLIATIQNHYPIIDYILQHLGDNFDDYIIQLIFLAYQQNNFYLAHKLLHRPIYHNTIQYAQSYLLRAIGINALFLVEIMLKHWYHNPEKKKHLHPYGYAIDIQDLYNQALIMNHKEIIDYLKNQYAELENEETLYHIINNSDDVNLLRPAIEDATEKIKPASTFTKKVKVFCEKTVFPMTVCTLFFFYNQMISSATPSLSLNTTSSLIPNEFILENLSFNNTINNFDY